MSPGLPDTNTGASYHTSADTKLLSQFCGREGVDQVFSFSRFFQHDSRHHRYAQLVYIRFPRTINCMRSWILWNLIFLISEISTRLWAFGPGEKARSDEECQGERSVKWEGELGMIIRFKPVIWTTMVLIKLLFINCWYRHRGTKLSWLIMRDLRGAERVGGGLFNGKYRVHAPLPRNGKVDMKLDHPLGH